MNVISMFVANTWSGILSRPGCAITPSIGLTVRLRTICLAKRIRLWTLMTEKPKRICLRMLIWLMMIISQEDLLLDRNSFAFKLEGKFYLSP